MTDTPNLKYKIFHLSFEANQIVHTPSLNSKVDCTGLYRFWYQDVSYFVIRSVIPSYFPVFWVNTTNSFLKPC